MASVVELAAATVVGAGGAVVASVPEHPASARTLAANTRNHLMSGVSQLRGAYDQTVVVRRSNLD
jgi:hypothetical protein